MAKTKQAQKPKPTFSASSASSKNPAPAVSVTLSIDSTSIKAHRSASGVEKGGTQTGDRSLTRRTNHENPRVE